VLVRRGSNMFVLDRAPNPVRSVRRSSTPSSFTATPSLGGVYAECGGSGFSVGALQIDQGPGNRAEQMR
jgi:hypothetical protein